MTLAWPVTARLLGSGGRTIGPRFAPPGRSPAGRHNGKVVLPITREVEKTTEPGLAHVATVSFLASRVAPSLQFFFALGGGIALARSASRLGARIGYGTSLAAMLQTVAVMGPARINAPLTQAITAPMLGAMERRGAGTAPQVIACFAIRLAHYTVVTAALIWIILGGLDAYTGS